MNKKTAVIASVLKPVNDSRNYEKTAISISKSGKYKVHIVGQKVQDTPMGAEVVFNPIFSFHRLSIKRLFAGWNFLLYLFRIKPALVVVTTFELLFAAIIYKIIKGGKLMYDVQENYYRNLVYTNSFPPILKHIFAIGVRFWEYMTCPFVNQYILAEKNYEKEFSFTKAKSIVRENKLRKSAVVPRVKRNDGLIQFIYTGTIAENYGIFEAVELVKLLYQQNDKVRLIIVGYCSRKDILGQLKEKISHCNYITLEGGDSFVSHPTILKHIAASDFGLISYRPDKSTENCIPTKLYEYLAHQLPYFIGPNPIWKELTDQYKAGEVIDFYKPDINKILSAIQSKEFYVVKPGEEIYWEELEL